MARVCLTPNTWTGISHLPPIYAVRFAPAAAAV
jgi:hypothetical protein